MQISVTRLISVALTLRRKRGEGNGAGPLFDLHYSLCGVGFPAGRESVVSIRG
jgi:hypothetical protein